MARVTMRRASRTDGRALIKGHLESRDHLLPWVDPFMDAAGFETWYAQKAVGPHVSLLALDKKSGEIAGVVNINEIVLATFQSAYLGFYAMARFAGQGLMTEAVGQAVQFAFSELGLHRLEANIQPANSRSIALVKRLGFRNEGLSPRYLKIGGEWRDHERWAILAD